MTRTIGKDWPKSAAPGDYAAACDICGAMYRRSQLVRMRDGNLACTGSGTNDDAKGRDAVTLDALNATRRIRPRRPHRGGKPDPVEPPPFPFVRRGGNVVRPKVLILGQAYGLRHQDDAWWYQVMRQDFDATYFYDQSQWTGTPAIDEFDVIILPGDAAEPGIAPSALPEIVEWCAAGGGIVSTAWVAYYAVNGSPDWAPLYNVLPVSMTGADYAVLGESGDYTTPLIFTDTAHPIARDLPSSMVFPFETTWNSVELRDVAANGGVGIAQSTVWSGAVVSARELIDVIFVKEHGEGRIAYFNMMQYLYASEKPDLISSDYAKLYKNAVWWAAGGDL